MTNPYESPRTPTNTSLPRQSPPWFERGLVGSFFALMCVGVLLGILQTTVPVMARFLMPRFGWVGLYNCAYPMIFLVSWLRSPSVRTMRAAALISFAIGAIHAVGLLVQGTVAAVANPFSDRLHSSWFFAVMTFVLMGATMFVLARKGQPVAPAAN